MVKSMKPKYYAMTNFHQSAEPISMHAFFYLSRKTGSRKKTKKKKKKDVNQVTGKKNQADVKMRKEKQ